MPADSDHRYVWGVNPVLEALRARASEVERLYVTDTPVTSRSANDLFKRAKDAGIRVQRLPRERLAAMAEGGVHQGVVAELRTFAYAELEDILDAAKVSDRPCLLYTSPSPRD